MKKNFRKVVSAALASTMVIGVAQGALAGTHIVKEGEWLSTIAPKYDTTWQKLAETNKLENPDLIYPGQNLQVPDKGAVAAPVDAELVSLDVNDITEIEGTKETGFGAAIPDNYKLNIFDETKFDPDKTNYDVKVQSDIYGVLIKADADAKITVTAEKTTKNYKEADTYVAGTEIPYSEKYGGWIVYLDQTYASYDSEAVQTAVVKVEDGKEYKVNITRECDKALFDKFEQDVFACKLEDGTDYEIEYNIYYPPNYKTSNKEYPVVLALHGFGQSAGSKSQDDQPVDMILKRYQLASIWAKDSEADPSKECIVIAPQVDLDLSSGWATTNDTDVVLAPAGQAAYALLESVITSEKVDEDRIYVTGASMGGQGTWGMLNTHPETFAAAIPCCGKTDIEKYDWEQLKANFDGKVYFMHSEDDASTVGGVNYEEFGKIVAALDKVGMDYNTNIYPAETIFYPTPHFSWTPAYADKEIREWLFAQAKDTKLTGLDVVDITTKNIFDETKFNPAKTSYEVTVQSDIYGVLIKADNGLKVTADSNTYAYGATEPSYVAGTKIAYDAELGGYVVYLDQRYESYDKEIVQNVTIEASDKTYTVKVIRECDKQYQDLFEVKKFEYKADNGVDVTVDYNYYIPDDVKAGEKLPVVFALHGGGQSYNPKTGEQPVDMMLKRYQMVSIWAKDSELDDSKRAIVVAPQMNNTYTQANEGSGWGGYKSEFVPKTELTTSGQAAYALLADIIENNPNADPDRVYVLGASQGGTGTFAMLHAHPETFAGAIAMCPRIEAEYDFERLEPLSGNLYVIRAIDDPNTLFETYKENILAGLDEAGIEYEYKHYAENEVFYPTGHFSWTPALADEDIREWLFEQER